jgi:hypothetical protein
MGSDGGDEARGGYGPSNEHLGVGVGSRRRLPGESAVPNAVDFNTVSTTGLESSPVAAALAGLRANEARYFKNKYGHVFTVEPASKAKSTILFTHANEHRTIFRAMVGKRSGAVVQQMLQKMLADLVREEVKGAWVEKANETPIEGVSQFIGGGLFGLLCGGATGTCGWLLTMSIQCSAGWRFRH